MNFDFRRMHAPRDEAWGELQVAVQRWVLAHGGNPELARLAAWASLADAQAHAALDLRAGLDELAPMAADAIDALRGQPMVGDGEAPSAFVLDRAGRLFLWRNHAREAAIATAVRARVTAATELVPDEADLDALFHGDNSAAVQAQRAAVAGVPGRSIGVLTGGPGTGKTTTVLRVLAMAQRQQQLAGEPPARIAIAAPTGKAAQRLVQALRDGKRALAANAALPAHWLPLLEAIPDAEAMTVHRLLGFQPWDGRFARGPGAPLEADIVVVDEASMLDLAQLHALLAALRPDARLLLLGDADQLTSVGTGTVLMDLVAALEGRPCLHRLTHVFRSARAPMLSAAVQAARTGDGRALREAADGAEFALQPCADARALHARLDAWADALAALPLHGQPDARGDAAQALDALQALASRQLLTALRTDAFGSEACNVRIEERLRLHWDVPADASWYPGRAVMVVRNDPQSGLFNGDVGICLDDGEGQVRVWFEAAARDGQRHARSLPPAALPEHVGAFAVTIHKSQGSEFGHVAVLLPPDPGHRILSRQLLYTGLSRASGSAELWATSDAVDAALERVVTRVGGLRERLQAPTGD